MHKAIDNRKNAVDWDKYFYTELKPMSDQWSIEDLNKYRNWYYMWLYYINSKVPIFSNNKSVLEIGSGIGGVVSLLKDRGIDITGSDVSRKIIGIAQNLIPESKFIFCDIQKFIPFDKKYDIVFSFEVLEHLLNPQKALINIYKVLNEGGYFIGSTPYPYDKNFLDRTHISVHYPIEWKSILHSAGFRDVQLMPMSFLPALWRLTKYFNIPIPVYIKNKYCVSTILIIAHK